MIPDTTAVRAIRAAPRTRCCTRFKHTSITASTSVLYSQILHGREQAWHMYTCICELWSGSITSLRTRTVRTKRYGGRQGGQGKVVRLQPSRFGRDSCSVERMACAHALEVFFGGSGKDDFPVFYLRHCFVPSIFRKKMSFLLIRTSSKTARLATTLGSLCRERFGVHYHPRLGALRVVYRVSRVACATCNAIFFLKKKKKQAAVPNSAWAQL